LHLVGPHHVYFGRTCGTYLQGRPRLVWCSSWTIPNSLIVMKLFNPWFALHILPQLTKIALHTSLEVHPQTDVSSRPWETILHPSRSLLYLKCVNAVITHSVSLFRWPTAELRAHSCANSYEICDVCCGAGVSVSPSLFYFHLLITIPPLLHMHLLACNSPDQVAHWHISGTQAEDFNSNRQMVGHTVTEFFLNVS
jgi:hypothetical protein